MSTLTRVKAATVLTALLLSSIVCAGDIAQAAPVYSGAQQPIGIVALRHAADGAQTRIILEGTAELPYTIYKPDERTILVDLPGVDASKLNDSYAVDSRGVERIQVERLRTASGQSLARLRIRLLAGVEDRTVVEGKNLVLTLTAAGSEPATASSSQEAPATMKAEAPVTKPAASQPVAPLRPVSTQPSVPKNPATVITAVRTDVQGDTFRAFISTDGRAQITHFVLPNPDRIVVDITGVRSTVERNSFDVSTGGISRIRIGQFRTNDPRVVRVVFDVAKMGPYDVRQVGSDVVLSLGPGAGTDVALAKPAPEAPKPAVASPTESKPAASQKPAPEPKVERPLPTPIVGAPDEAQADNPSLVKTPTKAEPKATKPAPTPAKSATPAPRDPARNPAMMSAAPVRNVSDDPGQDASGRPMAKPATRPASTASRQSDSGQAAPPRPTVPSQNQTGYLTEGFVGRPVNLDLKNVDLRDVLRFLHNQYKVNFIIDRSVGANVPVDVSIRNVPWNQALDSLLKSQQLGAIREGDIIRIATVTALSKEREDALKLVKATNDTLPLMTKIYKLKYLTANPRSGITSTQGGQQQQTGTQGAESIKGGIIGIVRTRLSSRGRIDMDERSNSIIVSDLPAHQMIVAELIQALDRPEPQVEIEARIVVANRNFARDLGVFLSTAVGNPSRGGIASFITQSATGTGSTGTGGTGTTTTVTNPALGNPLLLTTPPATAAGESLVTLTTGTIGTFQISAFITASERKGQVRTIASPRVTTLNTTRARVVNGVQIPVQTVTNNTVTTTFVDASLSLEITPQIIIEDGAVLLRVLASNNSPATGFSNVSGTPGIATQQAEAIVLVPDGGTTILGGISTDIENQGETRTPGISRIPILGNLFKRKTTSRSMSEVLFFITPRIFRPELVGLPESSALRTSDITITSTTPAVFEGSVSVSGPEEGTEVPQP